MAFMNQERKKKLAALLKEKLKDVPIKYSLSVEHHSSIVMTIKSGAIDFLSEMVALEEDRQRIKKNGCIQVNVYHYKDYYTGKSLEVLEKIIPCLNTGNHDRSDAMTDYFDVGWYVSVNIGRYDKTYVLTKGENEK